MQLKEFQMNVANEILSARILKQKNSKRIIPDTGTIEALFFPRTEISLISSLARDVSNEEMSIYLLIGEAEPGKLRVYVGQSRQIKGRLGDHCRKKQWWDKIVYFLNCSRSGFSAEAANYLERLLFLKLKQANRAKLDNKKKPMANEPNISPWDKLKFENFYNEMVALAESFNLDIFDKIYNADNDSTLFYCQNSKGANATAYFRDNNIFVQSGSECRPTLTDSGERSTYIAPKRSELINDGILKFENGRLFFTQEYKFETPSAASSVIMGTPTNGWNEWMDNRNNSLNNLFREINQI